MVRPGRAVQGIHSSPVKSASQTPLRFLRGHHELRFTIEQDQHSGFGTFRMEN